MREDMMQGTLKQLRDAVKQRWGALTDKDLDTVDEKLDKLPGMLRARYGYTGEQAAKEIDLFLSSMKPCQISIEGWNLPVPSLAEEYKKLLLNTRKDLV